MKVGQTLILATLMTTLAWILPGNIEASPRGQCSEKQPPRVELKCGHRNLRHANNILRFLRNHPDAGDSSIRQIILKDHRWLKIYGLRHIRKAKSRMQAELPPIDSCLREIIRYEGSGFIPEKRSTWYSAVRKWNTAGSGAYGIPQALPARKMASAGRDWATNAATQVKWMIGYVNGRYGGSCSALAYWKAHGSY